MRQESKVSPQIFALRVGGFHPPGFHASRGFVLRDGQFAIIVGSYSGPTYNYNDSHGFARIDGQCKPGLKEETK